MKRCHLNPKPDVLRTENTVNSRNKMSKSLTPETHIQRFKDKPSSIKATPSNSSNQHFLKGSSTNKQQNVSPDTASSMNTMRYSPLDDSAVVEVTVKTSNPPKPRSRSTVSDRQPWGQLLNKRTHTESESVFGKFDPLRTLHFLARELQTHANARIPEDASMQEIIKAMHSAMKRIPPEVASTVQLQQQAIELLPKPKKSMSRDSFDGIHSENVDYNKAVPTAKKTNNEMGEIHKLIEGSTMKLEASCRNLENLCGQLRDEKVSLEMQLQAEQSNSKLMKARIEELENRVENANKQFSLNLIRKDEELADQKKSNAYLQQDVSKLQHQLRVCAIEKEKYLAILAVRDRQIYEIKNEMAQLQQSVNEQLVDLHNDVWASVPECGTPPAHEKATDKDIDTISSIYANGNIYRNKSDQSFIDLDSEDEKVQQRPTHDVFRGMSS